MAEERKFLTPVLGCWGLQGPKVNEGRLMADQGKGHGANGRKEAGVGEGEFHIVPSVGGATEGLHGDRDHYEGDAEDREQGELGQLPHIPKEHEGENEDHGAEEDHELPVAEEGVRGVVTQHSGDSVTNND